MPSSTENRWRPGATFVITWLVFGVLVCVILGPLLGVAVTAIVVVAEFAIARSGSSQGTRLMFLTGLPMGTTLLGLRWGLG